MATNNSNLIYVLYQDNRSNSTHAGEWYARVKSLKTYTWEEFIRHVADHGSVFTRAEISGVLYKMMDCLLELLLTSNKVQLGDLGTFYVTCQSTPCASPEDFDAGVNIVGTRLRFLPSHRNINDLSAKALRKQSKYKNITQLMTEKELTANTPAADDGE